MDLPFKVCPQCGAEHVHTASECADCRVPLELADARRLAPEPLPAASELQRVAAGGPWEMERLALELQKAGISSRIDAAAPAQPVGRDDPRPSRRAATSSSAGLALYVLPEEAGSAERILRRLLLPEETDAPGQALPGAELDRCPACGTAIPEAATACADCGLEFVALEES